MPLSAGARFGEAASRTIQSVQVFLLAAQFGGME